MVDDNDAFRESLTALLDDRNLDVVGQAASGTQALEEVRRLTPDVVLMDIRMPDMDGIEVTRRLKETLPAVGVVALTGIDEQRAVREMLVAGASGYVLKDSDGDQIVMAVERAAMGGALLAPEVTRTVIEELTEALERERRRAHQLELAQEALLERAARRQDLVSRLGHELRTPVSVVLGLAQTLRRGNMTDDDRERSLSTLISRAQGLTRLVRRFEAAVEAGFTEWANVTELAREVALRDPRIRLDAPAHPIMTVLNRTAGLRILEELVDNALCFSSPETEVRISVSTLPDGPQVRVTDEGSGVPDEVVERIFSPLEQAEDLHTRTHQGPGLGLSLAKLSARAMDGDVLLESTGPGGSTFLWKMAHPTTAGTQRLT